MRRKGVVAVGRVRRDVAVRPKCSRPGHENSRVWVYGTKGPVGHKRMRWKCVPANGDRPHEFSEALPRQMTHTGYCIECERDYGQHEGPQSARNYAFTTREVANALIRVGQGASYREAAFGVRARAERWPSGKVKGKARVKGGGSVRRTTHGQLVGDFIEVFAPVVYEPHHDFEWPKTGSVLLDELPFRQNTGIQGGGKLFSILAAMGWDEERKEMRLWALQAHADGSRQRRGRQWRDFLSGLSGVPARVVCDQGPEIVKAVHSVWPQTEIHYCEYHLRARCEYHLRAVGLCQTGVPAYDVLERAFDSAAHFNLLRAVWLATKLPVLRKHVRRLEKFVPAQLAVRARYPSARDPVATGALEQRLRWLRGHITPRAGRMTNQARLNRMLLLMLLESNGQAREDAYARAIQNWLLANGGRPRLPRRAIADAAGIASLRP